MKLATKRVSLRNTFTNVKIATRCQMPIKKIKYAIGNVQKKCSFGITVKKQRAIKVIMKVELIAMKLSIICALTKMCGFIV
jgi:hypothetical protein